MIQKDYNTLLYDKMKSELDKFIAELKTKSPEQIIELAYELTIKEDLLSIFENTDFHRKKLRLYIVRNIRLILCIRNGLAMTLLIWIS